MIPQLALGKSHCFSLSPDWFRKIMLIITTPERCRVNLCACRGLWRWKGLFKCYILPQVLLLKLKSSFCPWTDTGSCCCPHCVYRDNHAMGQSCTDLETVSSASQLCWSKDRVSVQMAGMQIWYDHHLEVLIKHLCRMNSLLPLFLQCYKLQGERIEWKSRKNVYHKLVDKANQNWAELEQSWWQRPGCDSEVRLSSHVTFRSCCMNYLQGFLETCQVSWVITQEISSKGLMDLKVPL